MTISHFGLHIIWFCTLRKYRILFFSLLIVAAVVAKHQTGQLVNLLTDAGAITVNLNALDLSVRDQTLFTRITTLISNETIVDFVMVFYR